jgi:cytochrome c oxidase subunit 4
MAHDKHSSHGHDAHGHDSHGHGAAVVDHTHHAHVCSFQTFFGIYIALLFLTFVTVEISRFDFGSMNMLIAMAIATVKASLVMTVFMHLKWDTAMNNLAFLGSLIFLSLLFLFTLADHATRGVADPVAGTPVKVQTFGQD